MIHTACLPPYSMPPALQHASIPTVRSLVRSRPRPLRNQRRSVLVESTRVGMQPFRHIVYHTICTYSTLVRKQMFNQLRLHEANFKAAVIRTSA